MMTQELINDRATIGVATQACVVLYAGRIWKGVYFQSLEQAAGAIRGLFRKTTFRTGISNSTRLELLDNNSTDKYVIVALDLFQDMNQIQ